MERNQELANESLGSQKTPELDALAGRALDIVVAERVMGWVRHDDCGEITYSHKGHHPIYTHHLPRYSTDIAAAMEVINKIRAQGYSVTIQAFEGSEPWSVGLMGNTTTYGDADVLPEAICRAALKAVKSKE